MIVQKYPTSNATGTDKVKPNLCKLPFISINVPYRRAVQQKTLLLIFPHTNFIKNIITIDVSNGINASFVRHELSVHLGFQILLQFLDLFWGIIKN